MTTENRERYAITIIWQPSVVEVFYYTAHGVVKSNYTPVGAPPNHLWANEPSRNSGWPKCFLVKLFGISKEYPLFLANL